MKISVIVAAYNAEEYLLEAMESALNQTLDEYEVIVVNDGSTDNTLSILEELACKYDHLKIINKENGGPASARNTGIKEAQGKYIYFVDSDDIIEIDALEKFYDRAESTEADLVIANYDIFSKDSVTKIKNLNGLIKSSDINKYSKAILWTFSLWNKLFKKSVIDEYSLSFPPISYTEDGVFTMNFVYKAEKIVGLNKVVYHYRRMYDGSGNAITASVNASKIKQYIKAHQWIYEAAVKSIESVENPEEINLDPKDYLGEIHRKEVQILFNQFYRNLWTLDDESIQLIVNEIKDKYKMLNVFSLSMIMTDNYETPLFSLTTDKKEILKNARFTVVLYGRDDQAEIFLSTLKSIVVQSLVELQILVPESMEQVVRENDLFQDNIRFVRCVSEGDLYNKALKDAVSPFIAFCEPGFSYPNNAFKRVFKYMSNGFCDMAVQTVYHRNYGSNLPIYFSYLAFNSARNGTRNNPELCLDHTLSNKFFRTEYLRSHNVEFGENPREILSEAYDKAYWVFLNDKIVFFDNTDIEYLHNIGDESTYAFIEKYCEEHPVDLSDPEMGYDSDLNFTKMMKYPRRKRGNRVRSKFMGLFRRMKVKDRVVFLSVRKDGQLEGNAKALYPYVKGKKVIYAKKLPHGYLAELRMLYYFMTSKVIVTDDYVRYARWVKLRQGQRMIQLWHACGAFKMFGQYGTNMSVREDRATHAQYSLAVVSGPSIRTIYADAFDIALSRVASLGCPKTDCFFDEEYIAKTKERVYEKLPYLKDKQVILYAPTFRDVGGKRTVFTPALDFEKLSRELKPSQEFVICPHPLMENKIVEESYPNIHVVREISTSDMMFVSDMMVTDYSSVVFEYALLKKPMAFFCYDLAIYDRGFFLKYPDDLPGKVYENQEQLMAFLHNPNQEVQAEKCEEFVHKYMAGCDGHSGEKIAAIINAYMEVE